MDVGHASNPPKSDGANERSQGESKCVSDDTLNREINAAYVRGFIQSAESALGELKFGKKFEHRSAYEPIPIINPQE